MIHWQVAVAQADQLGESPFWHPREEALYWVDIPGRQLRRANAYTGRVESWEMPQEPGCIAPAASGGLVIALRDGIYRAQDWGGPLVPIARFSHDPATTRFNDGKADALGRFWAGTIYEPKVLRKAELYSVDCRPDNGEHGQPLVQLKAHNAVTANGLAWSPDDHIVYWADTPHHVIHAWDYEPAANVMRRHRIFHAFAAKPAGWQPGAPGYGGRPDGAAVDAEGNYWCAMYEGARLVKLSPSGDLLESIPVPVLSPTMPCFGGVDLQTLYFTCANGSVHSARVPVPGLPVNFFID